MIFWMQIAQFVNEPACPNAPFKLGYDWSICCEEAVLCKVTLIASEVGVAFKSAVDAVSLKLGI